MATGVLGIDALTLAPAGLGKVVTKVAPMLREGRFLKPTTVVHASNGEAASRAVAASTHANAVAASTTDGPRWGDATTLVDHFERHGADFLAATPTTYVESANRLLQRSKAERLPTKVDGRGTIRVYDPASNTFGSYNPDGSIKTFFRPDPRGHGKADNWAYLLGWRGVEVQHGN